MHSRRLELLHLQFENSISRIKIWVIWPIKKGCVMKSNFAVHLCTSKLHQLFFPKSVAGISITLLQDIFDGFLRKIALCTKKTYKIGLPKPYLFFSCLKPRSNKVACQVHKLRLKIQKVWALSHSMHILIKMAWVSIHFFY